MTATASAQQERKPVRQGNELYRQKKYDEAEKKYDQALEIKPNLIEGHFNKGNVRYQQKDFEAAKKHFETAAALSNNPLIKAKAYHNLGNALLEQKQYKESIEAYKNALKQNPHDADTKYNLAYALQMLKQNPQQNQQQQNKDKDQNKDNKNQQQEQQQDKNETSQNNQGNKEEQDKKQQQQNEPQQASSGEKDKEKPQPRQAQLSKAEAEKLLEALQQEEQKVQERLQKNKGNPVKIRVEKDW